MSSLSALVALPVPVSCAALVGPVAGFATVVASVAAALGFLLPDAGEFDSDFGAVDSLSVHVVDGVTRISGVVILLCARYNKSIVGFEVEVPDASIAFEDLLQRACARAT